MPKACIDAGVLDIFFSENPTQKVSDLMDSILTEDIKAYLLRPILVESYYHICKLKGIEIAQITIASFIQKYPVDLVNITSDLIFSAGKLKCQNRKTLSYNDCLSIGFCLNNKVEFHTTEKNLKNIPNNTLKRLKTETYKF
jgi:predicted nucleic acid-binding protein